MISYQVIEYIFWALASFMAGTAMGSFLKVVVDRHGVINASKGRSHCDSCGYILQPIDLIPILSFLLAKGKCRKCGAELSKSYLYAELFSGVIFMVTTLVLLLLQIKVVIIYVVIYAIVSYLVLELLRNNFTGLRRCR